MVYSSYASTPRHPCEDSMKVSCQGTLHSLLPKVNAPYVTERSGARHPPPFLATTSLSADQDAKEGRVAGYGIVSFPKQECRPVVTQSSIAAGPVPARASNGRLLGEMMMTTSTSEERASLLLPPFHYPGRPCRHGREQYQSHSDEQMRT